MGGTSYSTNNGFGRNALLMNFRLAINFKGVGLRGRIHFFIEGSKVKDLMALVTKLVMLTMGFLERVL